MSKVNDKCIGCGVCVNVCPDGFEMNGAKAIIKSEEASCLEAAADACPVGAIEIDSEKNISEGTDINQGNGRGMGQGGGRGMGMGGGRGMGRR